MRASKTRRARCQSGWPCGCRRQGRSRIRRGEKIDELPEIVSVALRGTDAVGSCTIRRDEYDVDEDSGEDAGGVDDSK